VGDVEAVIARSSYDQMALDRAELALAAQVRSYAGRDRVEFLGRLRAPVEVLPSRFSRVNNLSLPRIRPF
jgi:hypothetical protein